MLEYFSTHTRNRMKCRNLKVGHNGKTHILFDLKVKNIFSSLNMGYRHTKNIRKAMV